MLSQHPNAKPPNRKETVVNVTGILLAALLVVHPNAKNLMMQSQASSGPVSISVGQPAFGFNVIPNSTRRIFATVTNGNTNQVVWSLKSGSATLSSNSGSWIDVTAPATGTSCAYVWSDATQTYSVSSATQFTVEAASVDDGTKVADVTFNVCKPGVEVSVVPFYRTLYASQPADVQSFVLGAVDQSVTWAITSQPSGGDGKLQDATSRDTVFNATVPGRYTLTATSNADSHQTQSAIMYVTGHTMPYKVTPNQTEPVDCTVDPAMQGTVYEVGPSQAFTTLAAVPFPTMAPGSTVRLHNEDTTGLHPTEYHEYVQISQQATATQPFRMCGVPDSLGNLPIMDGANATGRSDTSVYAAGYGLLALHTPGWDWWPSFSASGYVAVEGIEFRNARDGFNYTAPDGSAATWSGFSACIRSNQGLNTSFVGNEMNNCGNGVFSEMNTNGGWHGANVNVLWEGNHVHNSGQVSSPLSHQMYLQAWNEVVQFNRVDGYTPGAQGANLKSRGIGSIIRYNYFGDGALRQLDLVDVQDTTETMTFAAFLWGGTASIKYIEPQDPYPADRIAAEQEAWNSHFVYGNIYLNSSAVYPIHFGMDHDGGEPARKGSLYWYNNTFYEKLCGGCQGQRWTLFDTSAGGGNNIPQTEFQTVQAFNNIIWMDDPARPIFQWNNYNTFIGVAGKNVITANWGTNDQSGTSGDPGTGWVASPSQYSYQNAQNMASHLTGFNSGNLVTVTSMPFDPNTWILNGNTAGGTAVPTAICQMPARFSFLPSLGYAVPRIAAPNVGATDTAAETATQMNLLAGTGRYNTRFSNCH